MIAEEPESGTVASFPLVGHRDSEIEALTIVIRRLASAKSLPEVMEIVTHAARAMLAADGITFVLRDGEQCYYAEEDSIGPLWKGRRFPMSACISGWCMMHGRAVNIADIYDDERIPEDAYRPTFVKSLAMVPVRREEPIAALGAYWAKPHKASASELELLQTIANATALSIAYVQLRETQSSGFWRRLSRQLSTLPIRRSAQLDPWSPLSGSKWSQRTRAIAIGIAFAAAAFLVRLPLTLLVGYELPYATFYVAVALSVVVAGPFGGAAALITGGIAGNLVFVEPAGTFHLGGTHLGSLLLYGVVACALIALTNKLVATSRREKELNRKLQLVGGELQHRIKNFITVVQAIAIQTGRSSTDTADFDAKFTKRLEALSGAQALIDSPQHSTAGLAMLIQRILAPFNVGDRVAVAMNDDIRVNEDVAVGVALVLNELATNALKYGSLSDDKGSVSIEAKRQGDRASIVWREEGGPKVSRPSRRGFGTRLIRSAIPRDRGTTEIEYRASGVTCRMEIFCGPE